MIYLLKSAAYDVNTGEHIDILKIGYTKNIKKRLATYRASNPTIVLLHTIEGNEDVEILLHSKLESYRFVMNEWYKYDDYIIQGFFTSKTPKDFLDYFGIKYDGTEKIGLKRIKEKFRKEIIKNIIPLNNIISEGINIISAAKLFDSIESDVKLESDLYETIGSKYNVSADLIREEIVRYNTNLSSLANNVKVKTIVDKINIIKKDYCFTDKMRLICENDLTPEEQMLLINSISPRLKNFYINLGPERCKAQGYNITRMKNEIESSKVNYNLDNIVKDKITTTFLIGGSYTKADIKMVLSEIYNEIGYKKTPKASDLENYFEITPCLITNKETGKRDHGFKILGIKK